MYKDLGKVVIRKPLYAYNLLFSEDGETRPLEELVIQKLDDPIFLESIYWTSQDLHEQIHRYKNNELTPEKTDRLFKSLQKYIIRSATRCTPYGIFAGCSMADIGSKNSDANEKSYRKARIDMGLLYQLIKVIAKNSYVIEHLSYQLNNSIYRSGKTYRYVETLWKQSKVEYQTASIERTDLLDTLLENIKQRGHINKDEIFNMIGTDVAYDDKKNFFHDLVESQILVSELFEALTEASPLDTIRTKLRRVSQQSPSTTDLHLRVIDTLATTLNNINQSALGELPTDQMYDCLNQLKTIGIEIKQEHLFHIDLWNPEKHADQFSRSFLNDIHQAITIVAKLSATSSLHEHQLNKFKQLFNEKYGDSEIPLLKAIDMEQGIGFPPQSKLGNIAYNEISDLVSSAPKNRISSIDKPAVPFEQWLQKKVRIALETGSREIEISKFDVSDFESQINKLASEIAVMGTLLPSGKLLLETIGGANNLTLLGRFAYMNEELNDYCRSQANRLEQEKDTIYAEIVHLTEGRVANISRKTGFFGHQITYLAYSDQQANTISLNDLSLSIRQEKLILHCRNTGKRIIPVLTNAHNYPKSDIAVYHFLASLQHQGRLGLGIHWGNWINWIRFIPRIQTGNVILQRAKWQIMPEDICAIFDSSNPIDTLSKFLKTWSVPSLVCIQDGDNELFLDIEKEDYLSLLLQELKGRNKLTLVEWLFDKTSSQYPKELIRQFVLPLRKNTMQPNYPIVTSAKAIQHTFAPGSEWIYFKLYCGASFSDTLLLNVVKPVISILLAEKMIDKAFFIHYTDPHYHIRFRMHFTQQDNMQHFSRAMDLMQRSSKAYLDDGRIWKLQLDTYQREIERYDADHIENTETAFFYDTLSLLDILENESFQEDEQYRFSLNLHNIDNWLSLFKKSLEDKMIFCSDMANAFAQEYSKENAYKIDQFYRSAMGKNILELDYMRPSTCPLDERGNKLNKLSLPLENLASYIHMSINRWFASDQRLMEYISYRFMEKQYKKALFQGKK